MTTSDKVPLLTREMAGRLLFGLPSLTPQEIGEALRAIASGAARVVPASAPAGDMVLEGANEDLLRWLASYLGCGGYNADTVDPRAFQAKILHGLADLEAQALERAAAICDVKYPTRGTLDESKLRERLAAEIRAMKPDPLKAERQPAPASAPSSGEREAPEAPVELDHYEAQAWRWGWDEGHKAARASHQAAQPRVVPADAPPAGWMPIETAPRDSRTVIIVGGHYGGAWHTEFADSDDIRRWMTHWMPLPSPPSDTAESKA